jgi:oxygen-independent coproporphyrinogen-3 oxidase
MNEPIEETGGRFPQQLLRELDTPGPRYTSYPTADRFREPFDAGIYQAALRERAGGQRVGSLAPLSLYVHIPFCESVCYYCACNKMVTRRHERSGPYLQALEREMELHSAVIGHTQPVSQLHLGGGTPTFLTDDELAGLMGAIRRHFKLDAQTEVTIEVDPRTAHPERLKALADIGFNRVSFGVQDFNPEVQRAIHREQPFEQVRELMHAARQLGFASINTDLIYGLPLQTAGSFATTVSQVASLRPDRIALYAYAHLPSRFKPQRRIPQAALPTPRTRLDMLSHAISGFLTHGYRYIGMDHFALPDDALAVAKRQGRLHRNFQGYTTQPESDLIALGVSAIGRVGAVYAQNAKTLEAYEEALQQGRWPTVRGLQASRDDLVRRSVIMALMCQGRVDFEAIECAHLVAFDSYFATELERLKAFEARGLLEIESGALQVTPQGWYFVRAIAMTFDKYLQTDLDRSRFSRII